MISIIRSYILFYLSILYSLFQSETHVISSILHIAHEYDNESDPWPIEIESHDGDVVSISLEAGQVNNSEYVTILY